MLEEETLVYWYYSMLSSCNVVKEYHLGILIAFNFYPLGSITWWIFVWVDVYDFPISSVSEQKSGIRVGVHFEIWRIIQISILRVPSEITQISHTWHQHLLAFKNLSEVLCLESVSQVNVPRDFISVFPLVSNKDNSCHSSTSDIVLSICKCL